MTIEEFGSIKQAVREVTKPVQEEAAFALSALASEYAFFHHGAFFTHGAFREPAEDPINDWIASMPPDVEVIRQPCEKAIFQGFTAICPDLWISWDRILCAVQKEYWPSLKAFLCGCAGANPKDHMLYQPFFTEIKIPDPVLIDRYSLLHPGIPQIPVTVFCIESNTDRWELAPPIQATGLYHIVRKPPRAETIELAKTVLAGDLGALAGQMNPAYEDFMHEYTAAQRRQPEMADALKNLAPQ